MVLIALVGGPLAGASAAVGGWALALLILLYVFSFFGYFALFEALNGGRTPGKKALGIRVVMETGHAVTPTAAVVRNLVRLMDCFLPFLPILPGFLMVLLHRRHQRPGDLAGAIGRTTVTAERFVAHKREQWEAFRAAAMRVERAGVGALPPGEIPAFATRYREVAADLARARTYGVDARVIDYLERIVSAGHNAVYRARGRRRAPVRRYVLRDFPAAVVQSWR